MRRNTIIGGTAVLALAGTITILFVFANQKSIGDLDDELSHAIQRGDLTVSVTEQGTLESSNNTEIRNKVRGFSVVTQVVEVGKIVKKGEVLVKLDTKAIEDQLSTARTDVNTAVATLARSRADEESNMIALKAYSEKALEEYLKHDQDQSETRKTQVTENRAEGEIETKDPAANELVTENKAVKEERDDVGIAEQVEGEDNGDDDKGQFISELRNLQRAVSIAKARIDNAKEFLGGTRKLYSMSFANRQELEAHEFDLTQHELELSVRLNAIRVLKEYSRKKQLATLIGNLKASMIKRKSDEQALEEERKRKNRLEQELADCTITAPREGLVIYPSAAAWKETPDIDDGASVRMDQVLLLMPDLNNMQIKVGIHESVVDKLRLGMTAMIRPSDQEESLVAEVSRIASVTKPAGWWTGNVVKYDTVIALPQGTALRPGMTAEVKIILATHFNVIKIPVAAVIELEGKSYCWVQTPAGAEKRELQLGDSDEVFIVVESGVEEGERVILNPLARVEEAQTAAQRLINQSRSFKD